MPNAGSVVPKLLRLTWPVALARLGIMGMGVVDVMVVGQFAPAQLPYQALGWSPINVLTVAGIGLLTGVQVLAARGLGAGQPREAGAAWRRGLVLALAASAVAALIVFSAGQRLLTVFGIAPELAAPALRVTHILMLSVPLQLMYVASSFFLEAIQRPMAATVAMWAANVVNLVLNLVLVPKLGAEGSAWSTVAARFSLAALLLLWIWRLPDAKSLGVVQPATRPGYGALLRVGAAAAISHAAEAGAFSGTTILAGRQGPDAVAAYQILLNVLAIVFMLSLGVASATAVLTSEAAGRRDEAGATRASFGGVTLNGGFMLLAGLVAVAFAGPISRAYTANLALAATLAGLMWLAALAMAPDGMQVVAASALRARGDNWFPTASHLFAYVAVMPALAYWLAEARGGGVSGLILAIFWSSVLSGAVLCSRLWWLHLKSRASERRHEP
jgi:multidrug resistance protein, MATE family